MALMIVKKLNREPSKMLGDGNQWDWIITVLK